MTELVGILNLTPDSFSDGGRLSDAGVLRTHVASMLACGVHILDIGAESTRPGASPLQPREEWERLKPALSLLAREFSGQAVISVDTRHADTARRALDAGVQWINDVSGFQHAEMIEAVKRADCRLVMMHSLSVPADPAVTLPEDCDVIAELIHFARTRLEMLQDTGIERERVIFDPGIGFSKTPEQSLVILKRVRELRALELPLMIGHSRKSFLKRFTSAPPMERDHLTITASTYLAAQEVEYLRVHNAQAHAEMLHLWNFLHG